MSPWARIAVGAMLVVTGAAWALLHVGILLIADKPVERSKYLVEVGAAWGLLLLGVAVAALGAWIARGGWKARRA